MREKNHRITAANWTHPFVFEHLSAAFENMEMFDNINRKPLAISRDEIGQARISQKMRNAFQLRFVLSKASTAIAGPFSLLTYFCRSGGLTPTERSLAASHGNGRTSKPCLCTLQCNTRAHLGIGPTPLSSYIPYLLPD